MLDDFRGGSQNAPSSSDAPTALILWVRSYLSLPGPVLWFCNSPQRWSWAVWTQMCGCFCGKTCRIGWVSKILMEREGRRERWGILLSRTLKRSVQESSAHIQSHISAQHLPKHWCDCTGAAAAERRQTPTSFPLPQPLSRFRRTSALL